MTRRAQAGVRAATSGLPALLFLMAALVLGPQPATSHPHAWIDVTTVLRFDADGRAVALSQRWLFEPDYTAFALQDLNWQGGPVDQEILDAILDANMANLAAYDHFTAVVRGTGFDAPPVPRDSPVDASTRLHGRRLEMAFTVPFGAPVDLRTGPLMYSIHDPTYFAEIRHQRSARAILLDEAPTDCRHQRIPPTPTFEEIALAAAIDVTGTAPAGLGELFAEKVVVTCDPGP